MDKSPTNSYGHKRRIHLHHQPRKTKRRGVVDYYSLASCYYENGKNQKKIVYGIGELTKEQAEQYRFLLRALNGQIVADKLIDFDQVIYKDEKRYFDVLALNSLWKIFKLDKVFDSSIANNQKVSTEGVARILTINRLLQPSAKIKTIEWLKSTLLARIIGIDEDAYERNKIFRELAEIHKHKLALEKAFWEFSQKQNGKYDAYYFDGSTSWFEGERCPLADADLEKTRGFFPKVVGLMLITDNHGFPVAWEVVNGHTKDTTEFKNFVKRIAEDFGIKDITYCFDRGVASATNFDLIEEASSKFISAIRDNQIKDIFDLKKFKATRFNISERICNPDEIQKQVRRIVGIDGFYSFDENQFFKDLGIVSGSRYIVSFNYELFAKEHNDRQTRTDQTLIEIAEKNIELALAKRDRDYNVTERDLLDIFSKYRTREFFEYTLLPLTTSNKTQSFKIEGQRNKAKIEDANLTDGILIFITNHIEKKKSGEFELAAGDIVAHYKGKYVVENAFRELKSFIELRPFFVWTPEHVKAHYDISIIACFINNYIYRQMKELDVSLRDFYRQLEKAAPAVQLLSPSGVEIFKTKPITNDMKKYFEKLNIASISSPALHKSHGVFQ